MVKVSILFLLFVCTSCQKYYVNVQKQHVGRGSLASTFVQSPDPLQNDPPKGERLVINWRIPQPAFGPDVYLELTMIMKNYTQVTKTYPIKTAFGYITFDLLNDEYCKTGGLLTYKAEIKDKAAVMEAYEQVLWTELIDPPQLDYDEI